MLSNFVKSLYDYQYLDTPGNSKIFKRSVLIDDIITNFYQSLDQLEFLYNAKKFEETLDCINKFKLSIKNKEYLNILYNNYQDDYRFISKNKEGIEINAMTKDLFHNFSKVTNYK